MSSLKIIVVFSFRISNKAKNKAKITQNNRIHYEDI